MSSSKVSRRRFLVLTAATGSAALAAACGAAPTATPVPAATKAAAPAAPTAAAAAPTAAKAAAPAGPVTLNVWHIHNQATRKTPIDAAFKRFEAANPGVTVVGSIYENDPYKTKLKTVSGPDFPDLCHSWGGGWLKSFADAGFLADITADAANWKNVNPTAISFSTFNNKVYGFPYIISSTIMYYNKSLFSKYGLQVPTTISELTAVCDKFVANKVYPWAIGNKSQWPGAQYFVLLSMRLGGADIFQKAVDGKIKWTDPVFVKAGEVLQEWVKKGYIPPGDNGINYDTGGSRMMFYTEQCAMMVQTSGFISTCKSENADFFKDKLGLALFPASDDGKGKATDILGGVNAFSVSASSKNKAMATKLVGFMATDPQFQKELADGGSIGALMGIETSDPLLKQAMDQLAKATYLQNFIDQTLEPTLGAAHKDTTQALLGQTMTPVQAAEQMQKVADSVK